MIDKSLISIIEILDSTFIKYFHYFSFIIYYMIKMNVI